MGFFDKNVQCSFCGESFSFLGIKATLTDGAICSKCASNFSKRYNPSKTATVADIRAHLQYREENQSNFARFVATEKVRNYIEADKNLKKVYFPFDDSALSPDLLDFSQIIDYELNEDGKAIMQKKVALGKAAVGTLLLGPLGTIIGGTSGKSKSQDACTTMSIRVSIDSEYTSQVVIPLIKKDTKKSSSAYKSARDEAQKILSVLDVVARVAENDSVTTVVIKDAPAPQQNIADELTKMKSLLDSGIITQADFDQFKTKLLGI